LQDIIVDTPLLESPDISSLVDGQVLIKPECLQRTGSFKIRGAYNLMSQLTEEQAGRGVVAWSSGNHAQGVAAAGGLLGIKTTIVMPDDAPQAKIDNTKRLGGEVVLYDRCTGNREAIAREIAAECDAALVPSYEHPNIIAGQGTVGLEIMEQCAAIGLTPDQVLINCGGGGLSSGSAVAIKAISPPTDVYLVEPDEFDDTLRSMESGERMQNDPAARSICDALQTDTPGKLTFAINRKLARGVLTVTDAEVANAMRVVFQHLKLVVEPGGAVALAAVLAGKIATNDRITVVILSGGNVDADLFDSIQNGDWGD
jgi:threonine dehydratase